MTSISGLFANTFSYVSTNAGQKQTAASKPESVSASLEKTTPETAKAVPGTLASAAIAARDKLDAGYKKLGEVGSIYTSGKDWDAIGFRDFDRQTLYAISSNEGGLFSDLEVTIAKSQVGARISDIINSNDPVHNPTKVFREIVNFYDAASDDEKASFEWAIARASAQKSYMLSGGTENVGTGNRVVDKLMQAWDQVVARGGNSNDFANMPAYGEALTWWAQDNGGARHVDLNV
ncbi:hypothetical protein [Thalassospira sp.]|uniref:hypothetical protein n=1 Tax=Thalassospira sp. TaxID=1912094 RepID=UPI0027330662|nr:hypothetical protein [Thalassospira sp.]MDP2698747.1 hypothetical protein [Thalassospira sp.]